MTRKVHRLDTKNEVDPDTAEFIQLIEQGLAEAKAETYARITKPEKIDLRSRPLGTDPSAKHTASKVLRRRPR